MSAHLIELKSRYTNVFLFSTSQKVARGGQVPFGSVPDAARFLQDNFPDTASAGGNLGQICGWFGGGAISMQVVANRAQAYRQLAEAIIAGKLFVFELPTPEPEIESGASPASSDGGAAAKPNKPGGQSDVAPASTDSAVSNASGTNATDTVTPQNADVETCGDPVSMCTGEEILELIDFELPGPLPLQFKRTYRSSQSHENVGMGFGWRSNFHLQIVSTVNADEQPLLVLHNEEGRRLSFKPVAVGQTSYQLSEGLALRHEENGSLVLLKADNTHWVFVPVQQADKKQAKRWALHQVFDSLGNFLQLYYDRFNRLSRIDYTRKRGVELHYDKAGLLTTIEAVTQTDTGLQKLDITLAQYQFDQQRDLISATNQAGQTEQYNYQAHLIIMRQRASGFKHYFAWLGAGPTARCSRNWGDDGYYDYRFEYDVAQGIAVSTDSRGQRWQYFHNERNQLIKKIAPDGATWQYSWNSLGKKASETAPNGGITRYEFNEYGQLCAIEQADGATSYFQYNKLGQRCGYTDAENNSWQREFTSGGLLIAETAPDGSKTSYQYDSDGQLTKKTTADGLETLFHHNKEGQLLAVKQNDALTRYSYDVLGRLNGVSNAAGLVTEFERNSAGQITLQRQFDSAQPEQVINTKYQYDSAGRLISQSNPLQQQTQWQYQGLSQPVTLLQADGSALNYEYDKERNLTAIMRSDGARYELDYDGQERPIALKGFDDRVQQYQYDISGKVTDVTDAAQRQIKLKRDLRGRVIEQVARHQQQLHSNHFHYDKLGRVLRASNAQRKLRFSYNGNGQLTEQWQDDWHCQYQYDTNQRITALRLADGNTLHYRYNAQGQLDALTLNQQILCENDYDISGREVLRQFNTGLKLTQQYDAFSRLKQQHWQSTTQQQQRDYQYSALHQLVNIQDSQSGETEYHYNQLDQLIAKVHNHDASQNEQHQWDSFGNPQGDDIEVKQDRLIHYQQNHYQYDASGNQLSSNASNTRQQREFNGLNQLTSLLNGSTNNGSVANAVTRYEYDALGRRSAKITSQGRTDYLWQGNTLLGEHSNGEFTWYLFEPNSDKPLALIKNGKVYFYQLDQLGTPLSLTDDNNNIVWQAHYSVFGKASLTVNKIDNPIRFQGQYFDNESGLHYNHFRYYDPTTGRFISQDPIGLVGGINHYQYAPNHINWVDPLGLSCKEGSEALAVAAALAKPLPVPSPVTTVTSTVTRVAIGTAANDAVYGVGESLLSRVLPMAGATLTGLFALVYSPGLGGGLEEITGPDGTVYSKQRDEVTYHAVGADGESWGTNNPQDDIQYRMWKANGGEGSFEDWLSHGRPEGMERVDVDCFRAGDAITSAKIPEFDRQLQGQQDGLNNLTVQEYLDGRAKFTDIGRGNGVAQKQARKEYTKELEEKFVDQLLEQDLSLSEAEGLAESMAKEQMSTLAALHNPDMIAGGKDQINDFGDLGVNSSIGRQWRDRVSKLDDAANAVPESERPVTTMNAALRRC